MPEFDPQQPMPLAFRQRLTVVMSNPPESQYAFYGDLLTYLNGHKFLCSEGFTVKPQKEVHLRKGEDENSTGSIYVPSEPSVSATSTSGTSPSATSNTSTIIGAIDGPRRSSRITANANQANASGVSTRSSLSAHTNDTGITSGTLDSNARNIQPSKHRLFPDATIEQFHGPAPYRGQGEMHRRDIVRVVIEVGNATKGLLDAETETLRGSVVTQLKRYMTRMEGSWEECLWGIAIVREWYAVIIWAEGDESPGHGEPKWERLDSPQFVTLLNDIRDWCRARYDAPPLPAPGYERQFDAHAVAELPWALQMRFDGWRDHTPRQYSTYGAMLGYLIATFSQEKYIVKPQRLMKSPPRQSAVIEQQTPDPDENRPENPVGAEEDGGGEFYARDEADVEEPLSLSVQLRNLSLNRESTETPSVDADAVECVGIPDFTVEEFSIDGDETKDKFVLIVEIGSRSPEDIEGKDLPDRVARVVEKQLYDYMLQSRDRFDDVLFGLGFCGTKYCYMRQKKLKRTGGNPVFTSGGGRVSVKWSSIYSKAFSIDMDRIAERRKSSP